MPNIRFYKLKISSNVTTPYSVFTVAGKFHTLVDGKLYQMQLVKVDHYKIDSDNNLQLTNGIKIESFKSGSNDLISKVESKEDTYLGNNGYSSEFKFKGCYYIEKPEGLTKETEKEFIKKNTYVKDQENTDFEYMFVFVCVSNASDIIIPLQSINSINVKKKEVGFLEEANEEFLMDCEPFVIIMGVREKIAVVEKTTTTTDSGETLESISSIEQDEEDKKVDYFDNAKYFLLKDGSTFIADGENNINNTYFGSNVTDGTTRDIEKSLVEKEISKEEAEKISLNGEDKKDDKEPDLNDTE